MKNDTDSSMELWKQIPGGMGDLYRVWRLFSNIDELLLLKVTVNEGFRRDVKVIQEKLMIDANYLRNSLLTVIKLDRIIYFALRYRNEFPKDCLGLVEGRDDYSVDYDGLITKEPNFLKSEETKVFIQGMEKLAMFENSSVTTEISAQVVKLLEKYHLSYRYYRRIKSIVLYNDYPPVPELWNDNKASYEDISVKSASIKEISSLNKAYKFLLETEAHQTPVTYFDKEKKCIVVEIYPDTSLEVFSSKRYKLQLAEFQKQLIGFRKTDTNYDGYADILFYYFTNYEKMTQKTALIKLKKIYGSAYVKGYDSDATARASNKKRRLIKYAIDTSE